MSSETLKTPQIISQETKKNIHGMLIARGIPQAGILPTYVHDEKTGKISFNFRCELLHSTDLLKNSKGILARFFYRIPFIRFVEKSVYLELVFSPAEDNSIHFTANSIVTDISESQRHVIYEETLKENEIATAFDKIFDEADAIQKEDVDFTFADYLMIVALHYTEEKKTNKKS